MVSIEQDRQHCNGDYFESARFKCGAKVAWSPNFRRLEQPTPCPHSPEEVSRKERMDKAHAKLSKYIQKLDVDEEVKEKLLKDAGWTLRNSHL